MVFQSFPLLQRSLLKMLSNIISVNPHDRKKLQKREKSEEYGIEKFSSAPS